MRENLSDAELHCFCLRWAAWVRTRRYFAPPPVSKSILARMQPGRVRQPPNVELSADLSFFNLAVDAQPGSDTKTSFLLFYVYPARSVKEAAAAQGISRDAFYRRVKRLRRRAWRTAQALMQAQAWQRQDERASTSTSTSTPTTPRLESAGRF